MTFEEIEFLISDTIFNISVNAQAKVDSEFKEDINNSISLIAKTFLILEKIVNQTNPQKSDRDFDSQKWSDRSECRAGIRPLRPWRSARASLRRCRSAATPRRSGRTPGYSNRRG